MAQQSHKGGLGKGLGALIPSGPAKPRLSDAAADAILGGAKRDPRDPDPEEREQLDRERGRHHNTLNDMIAGAGARDEEQADSIGATYRELPIEKLRPNAKQPRTVFDEDELDELVHSIGEFGVLQPVVVRPDGDGFEIVMGERSWRAAGKAGLDTIPAVVRETTDVAMLRDALLENIHRVELNPLEEGAAYQQLLEEFGVTQDQLAETLGRSRPTITNTIRLLSLPVAVQSKVAAGVLSAGHARALMSVKTGEADQVRLAERIVAEGLSVRATEEAATLLNRGEKDKKRAPRQKPPQPEYLTRTAEHLADRWDTKVTVTMGKRKGKMVVEFGDEDDFQRIIGLIEGEAD